MNQTQIRMIAEQAKETCFLCAWTLQDLRIHGKLTDWPIDFNGKGQFPASGKLCHLELEQASIANRLTGMHRGV